MTAHESMEADGLLYIDNDESGVRICRTVDAKGPLDAVVIEYGSNDVAKAQRTSQSAVASSLTVAGVIGILDLGQAESSTVSHLVVITGWERVASLRGHAINVVTQITYVPLSSKAAAGQAITIASGAQARNTETGYASDESDHVPDDAQPDQKLNEQDAAALEPGKSLKTETVSQQSSTAVTQLSNFAQRWLPQKTRSQVSDSGTESSAAKSSGVTPTGLTIDKYSKRILRSLRLYLTSRSFYFSHKYDLSRSLVNQDAEILHEVSYDTFDREVFWNRHLLAPFAKADAKAYTLPLIQGFVGQKDFSVPNPGTAKSEELHLTLISRRSIKRAGLRYLRRGVDEDGNVANCVETEQILTSSRPDGESYSLLQLRGSIPLYFSQSPYSFKPTPQMFGSDAATIAGFAKHFQKLITAYGDVQVANLVDKHGPEVEIGKRYEQIAGDVNKIETFRDVQIKFNWFDFHGECKGMRFENVSKLIHDLEGSLRTFGWSIIDKDGVARKQGGIVRTNCMDCLDRTNVTQSAIAGWSLQQQFEEHGLRLDLAADKQSIWFNQLWADNGDAISKQYAGTAALKGDFTRTRKRNWTGALTDFSLTMNRFYNNIFGDYFLQTCIDYMLGNGGPELFDRFETDMTSQDNAMDIQHVRQSSINTCSKIVLEDPKESMVHGWTLSCPATANTLHSLPFEECVLLQTEQALYFCRFDWKSDKVGSFERIPLDQVVDMWRGTYITSALGAAHTDSTKNVGFVLRYGTGGRALVRTNTRSMDNKKGTSNLDEVRGDGRGTEAKANQRLLAFKIIEDGENVSGSCKAISDAVAAAVSEKSGKVLQVQDKDVVTLAEVQKSTGYAESLAFGLKKLIW